MFDSLSDRFEGIFKRLRGRGKLTEKDIDEVAREIRLALLEADVNVRVVKSFIARIKERANGAEVAKSLSPAQQVIKIVHEELVTTLGGDAAKRKALDALAGGVKSVGYDTTSDKTPIPSLEVLEKNGGDDGTRTRGLCRDRTSNICISNDLEDDDGAKSH